MEAEKAGKVSYMVWQEAKRLNVDPETLRQADEESNVRYRQEVSEYERYVRGDRRTRRRLTTQPLDDDSSTAEVRDEVIQLLRAFVRKNQHLGFEMP
jgi:hypothetical protein